MGCRYNLRVQDRPLWFMMYQRMLSSGVRTTDGNAADYFFIPMNIRGPTESMHLVRAIHYIRKHWPWWDKFHGTRHLILHTGVALNYCLRQVAARAVRVPLLGVGCRVGIGTEGGILSANCCAHLQQQGLCHKLL